MVNKKYCMSSFLMFRTVADENMCFFEGLQPRLWKDERPRTPIHDSDELLAYLKKSIDDAVSKGRYGLALSGGIDSAILAKLMPKGTKAYTFKCVVPGVNVIDESPKAAEYAKECGLEHEIIEIYFEDFERYAPILMKHKGAPIHSIEVQIYKASLKAKQDGIDRLVFGEAADAVYGGLSGLLSRDWTFGDFVNRYSFVMPYTTLQEPELILEPYRRYNRDGYIDTHSFIDDVFRHESVGSYFNATQTAGIGVVCPFAETVLGEALDYERIRTGENKYLVREVFNKLYPGWEIPSKIPMPRPMNEWFAGWEGPKRPEFIPHCTDTMNGDQKWLVWILEKFLNTFGNERD